MEFKEEVLKLHKDLKGKVSVENKMEIKTSEELSKVYTPGVSYVCEEIEKNEDNAYIYTMKQNTVAIVTNGTAVLGLGDIGALAGLPVMEGKANLFKQMGGVDAFPILIDSKDTKEVINTVKLISKGFGGINLEDIKAPECFEIERTLSKELSIPVFHDDQYGTAIVVYSALLNALKLKKENGKNLKFVINGVGAAGVAIGDMLYKGGFKNIIYCDSKGIINESRKEDYKKELSKISNPENVKGFLSDAMVGADIFIGVSKGNLLSEKTVKSMNQNPIIFAMANPVPEVDPYKAKEWGAFIVGTGRSDFPNQINNVSAFPGIFKGILEGKGKKITDEMKFAAAKAIADSVDNKELNTENIMPKAFDKTVADVVAKAVKELC